MNILFMGTPEFSVPCLERLISDGHNVSAVVSQADKPKGRGHKMVYTPVKECALKHGIQVFQPETLKDNSFSDELEAINPDVIIVVAYGKILPEYILNYPKYGCINIHASLLPKYRGAGPIQHSIIGGEKITGVTSMYMEKGLDTGDMLLREETEIGEYENCEELYERLSRIGAEVLSKTLRLAESGELKREKQNDSEATYAPMLTKATGEIDWKSSAESIVNLIRGTYMWPVAHTLYKGEPLKIYAAERGGECTDGGPGDIVFADKKRAEVKCGDGKTVILKEVQFFGGKRMSIESYLNGHNIEKITLGE